MSIVFPAGEADARIPLRRIFGCPRVIPWLFDARCAPGVNIGLIRRGARDRPSADVAALQGMGMRADFLPILFLQLEQLRSNEGVDPLAADYERLTPSLPRFPVVARAVGA